MAVETLCPRAICRMTLAALTVLLDGGAVQDQGSSADSLAVEAGAPHAGAHSLDDE